MSRDDALLALERHATSKIATAQDLQRIRTLGFRGEALPSIAAVSRFTLSTRERGALAGTRIEIAGGKILSVTDTGTAEGTTVEVRNLFFNLPARRKFLRSVPTETAHCQHIVTLCALAHPQVAFRLVVNEREAFNLAPTGSLAERLRELYGNQLLEQLVELPGPDITGFVGKPGVGRADRSHQHVFVNGRPVESRAIHHALREAYHTALMKGQFPVTFLFVQIDPELVDVNIHPAKREVRFRDESAVRQAVLEAVRAAIEPKPALRPIRSAVAAAAAAAAPAPLPAAVQGGPDSRQTEFAAAEIHTEAAGCWRLLGVIGQLYALLETPEGLVLVDQHAAHERVLFERMLKQLETDSAPSQKLLLPVTLELEARDAAFLQANLKTLHRLGIGISEFGERTFLVDALPPYFPPGNVQQTFRNIVDELRQTGEQVHARRLGEERIATTVCRHAVKARDPLRGEELRALLQQLHRCDLPYTCPHGRPTMIQISYAELEKKFGRKV
jgi:DNA mismatch repair protein MutL